MKRQTKLYLFVLLVIIILSSLTMPNMKVIGQTEPPTYIPFFTVNWDPDYAFGLDGGTVENVTIDPEGVIYAGTWGNAIYKSDTGGATWTHISEGLRSPYIYEISIDPVNPDHILASVYEYGIDQSFDGGVTWSPVAGFNGYSVVYSIDFDGSTPLTDPLRSSTVYAAVRQETYYSSDGIVYPGGVWKSTDGGDNWDEVTHVENGFREEDYIYDLAIDPNNPNIVYTANHRTGVYKTTNGGESWFKTSTGLIHQDIRGIQVNPVNGTIYAGIWDGYGFAYSTNGGSTWVNNSPSHSMGLYVYEIQYDPYEPNNVYLTTSTGVYLCVNPKANSTCTIMSNEGKFVFDLALDLYGPEASNGRTMNMYTGLQHFGLFKSDNGGLKFEPSFQGIRANIVRAVTIDPNNPDIQYVSASYRGLFLTKDGGQNWISLHGVLDLEFINEIVVSPDSSDVLFIGDKYGGIWNSTDGGETWVSANSGVSRIAGSDDVDADLMALNIGIDENDYDWMDPVDLNDLIDATGKVSIDRETYATISTIGYDPDDSTKLFAGKNTGGVVYSDNGGYRWMYSSLTSGGVLDSLIDPSRTQKYLIGMVGSGVMISPDRKSWTYMKNGLVGVDVYALALQDQGVYVAGTDQGAYRADLSVDTTWRKIGFDGFVRDLIIDPTNSDMIWLATLEGLYFGLPTGPEGAYEWTKFDVPGSNNDRIMVIEVIPGSIRDFYIGMDGGDLVKLPAEILP